MSFSIKNNQKKWLGKTGKISIFEIKGHKIKFALLQFIGQQLIESLRLIKEELLKSPIANKIIRLFDWFVLKKYFQKDLWNSYF